MIVRLPNTGADFGCTRFFQNPPVLLPSGGHKLLAGFPQRHARNLPAHYGNTRSTRLRFRNGSLPLRLRQSAQDRVAPDPSHFRCIHEIQPPAVPMVSLNMREINHLHRLKRVYPGLNPRFHPAIAHLLSECCPLSPAYPAAPRRLPIRLIPRVRSWMSATVHADIHF